MSKAAMAMIVGLAVAGEVEATSCYSDRVAYELMNPTCEYVPPSERSEGAGKSEEAEGASVDGKMRGERTLAPRKATEKKQRRGARVRAGVGSWAL